jgi:hypothetical protein
MTIVKELTSSTVFIHSLVVIAQVLVEKTNGVQMWQTLEHL